MTKATDYGLFYFTILHLYPGFSPNSQSSQIPHGLGVLYCQFHIPTVYIRASKMGACPEQRVHNRSVSLTCSLS